MSKTIELSPDKTILTCAGMTRLRACLLSLFAALLILTFAGCSTGPALHPVKGKVEFQGKPKEKARVTFHPVGFSLPEGYDIKRTAKTDDYGEFYIVPGLPIGKYSLTVDHFKKGKDGGKETNQLPARYADPAGSGLECDIVPGTNELAVIRIGG